MKVNFVSVFDFDLNKVLQFQNGYAIMGV